MMRFSGVMPALVSPLDANEKIKVPVLKQLLGDLLAKGADGFYLCGATADKIKEAVLQSANYAGSGIKLELIDDFDEAVFAASRSAEEGDIVLLSPACAAFDKFKNFAERGKHFKKLVMELE